MSDATENLLIDLGNSRVKWAISNKDDWSEGEPFENHGTRTDFAVWRDLKPSNIYVSNSAGDSCYQHLCDWCSGDPKPLASQQVRWVRPEQLKDYPFPAANARIIDALLGRLNKTSQLEEPGSGS